MPMKKTAKKTKSVLIISASFRPNSNSHALCQEVAKGVKAAGNKAEVIRHKDKKIGFCTGCYACQKLGKCVIQGARLRLSTIPNRRSATLRRSRNGSPSTRAASLSRSIPWRRLPTPTAKRSRPRRRTFRRLFSRETCPSWSSSRFPSAFLDSTSGILAHQVLSPVPAESSGLPHSLSI